MCCVFSSLLPKTRKIQTNEITFDCRRYTFVEKSKCENDKPFNLVYLSFFGMEDDDKIELPADTLRILQEFYLEQEQRKKEEQELLQSDKKQGEENFSEDWNLSQFWVYYQFLCCTPIKINHSFFIYFIKLDSMTSKLETRLHKRHWMSLKCLLLAFVHPA